MKNNTVEDLLANSTVEEQQALLARILEYAFVEDVGVEVQKKVTNWDKPLSGADLIQEIGEAVDVTRDLVKARRHPVKIPQVSELVRLCRSLRNAAQNLANNADDDCPPEKRINLHISLLPHNRGADPNFWSWANSTPKGITIHCLAPSVDSGDIILQRQLIISDTHTLKTSYALLHAEMMNLFSSNWTDIREGSIIPRPQPRDGSIHRSQERKRLWSLFPDGYDTPCWQVPVILGEHQLSELIVP